MRIRLKHGRLLELIGGSGLSQNHWAIKLGLSRGHWSGIVNGKHPYPSRKTRERLVELFGVPFEDLFEMETGSSDLGDRDFQRALSDRYVIDEEIGQGGMGTVYLARDVKLGRQVAIKVVSAEAVSGIGTGQFLREIRYTARLLGDIREFGPDRGARPTMYWSIYQGDWHATAVSYVLRTNGDPLLVAPAAQRVVRTADPELPAYAVVPLTTLVSDTIGDRRFAMTLLGIFAGLALLLSAVGIFGVMSYTVERRTRELGVRLALGASAGKVLRLVLAEGGKLAAMGIGLGLLGAIALRKTIAGLLVDVNALDPATLTAVAVLLGSVALLACYLPARRAATADPMDALRYE